ncbi:MAG: hydroxymethylbilane synthase [Tissierellia bacterium]|nr:hydroxymethylbilane synthase [Tissierellia bacterium]
MFCPIMVDISNKKLLIVGGGKIAYRKAKNFLSYKANVLVVSPEFIHEFYKLEREYKGQISLIQDLYNKKYIEGAFLVVGATSSRQVNNQVAQDCHELNILCNIVDKKEESSFISPGLVKKDGLIISISTMGKFPYLSKRIKEDIANRYSKDMAVHSMKDMPGKLPEGLKLSPPPIREDYRDVFVFREGIKSIEELPKGAKIGTGSKRRKYQILKYRPDLNIVPIRGNVETRIRKIEEENLDGVILAIEIRDKDEKVESILKGIYHRETEIQATVERGFLTAVGGSCKVPVGCYCEVLEDKIIVEGLLGSEEGDILIRKSIVEDINEYKEAGEKLGQILMREMTSK